MFSCEKLHATLSEQTCAQRHLSGKFLTCKDCAIGAANAGRPIPENTRFSALCQRCRTTGNRLVSGRLCISCYNRELEFKKGKDRRGKKPSLQLHMVTALVDGKPLTDLALSFVEMAVKAAKTAKPGSVVVPVHLLPYPPPQLSAEAAKN